MKQQETWGIFVKEKGPPVFPETTWISREQALHALPTVAAWADLEASDLEVRLISDGQESQKQASEQAEEQGQA